MHDPRKNNSCEMQSESDNGFNLKLIKNEVPMTRLAILFAAAALVSSPAIAGSYSAKPVAAPAKSKIVGRDIAWTCGANACQGSTESSRPILLCQDLAKRAGRIESFAADGRPLSAAELDKCNASAKAGSATSLATAN